MKLKAIKEKRILNTGNSIDRTLNTRAETGTDNSKRIIGYAALFNHPSKLIVEYHGGELREFTEIIEPGAFDKVLSNPNLKVIHNIDHERGELISRTEAGTLQLSVDDKGLLYNSLVPDTGRGRDLYTMISLGNYFESSFVFTVDPANERWVEKPDGLYRYITEVSGLYDVATVCDGAYSETQVVARTLPVNIIDERTATVPEAHQPVLEQTPVAPASVPEVQPVPETVKATEPVVDNSLYEAELFLLNNN